MNTNKWPLSPGTYTVTLKEWTFDLLMEKLNDFMKCIWPIQSAVIMNISMSHDNEEFKMEITYKI